MARSDHSWRFEYCSKKIDDSLVVVLKSEKNDMLDQARCRMWGGFTGFDYIAGTNHARREK
jgi:hypothetical protein